MQPWGGPRPGCQGMDRQARRGGPLVETLRRGINGAARFKFQISPRQMPLGKEQFVFAAAGGGRQGRALAAPHSQKLQPAHSAWSDTATCGGLALYSLQSSFQTLAQPHFLQQPGGEAGMHIPKSWGWWLREVEVYAQVTQHVSGRARI